MNFNQIYRSIILGAVCLLAHTSCKDSLDLAPIDHYGSGNFWKGEEQVAAYVVAMHEAFRERSFSHTIEMGEARGGGLTQSSTGSDGMNLAFSLLVNNNLSEETPHAKGYFKYYDDLANINLFIFEVEKVNMSADKKNYYLAQGYGLRAFYYFDLYRAFGGVPLRLRHDVASGTFDPENLYAHEATPEEVLTQIKADLEKSYELFGNVNSFDPHGKDPRKSLWNKAATEALMGQVYLWSAKVSTGNHKANEADLDIAKKHLENLTKQYGLALMDKFADVFEARNNKGNKEIIWAVRFAEGEKENNNKYFVYNKDFGSSKYDFQADGTPFADPLNIKGGGFQLLEYRSGLYDMYEEGDTRRDATFIANYTKEPDGSLKRRGTFVKKNIGYLNDEGSQVYCGDYVMFRLAEVYLMLAEIANMQGDNTSVAKYINLIRRRAYGNAYNEATHGYRAADFTTNELAILREKDKEFVQEGHRWHDLRRMQLTKGGKHLVFAIEANIQDGDRTRTPVLNERTEAHKVLWPIDKETLETEKNIYQTPGYDTYKARP